jgi:hypothetical protein
MAYSLYLDTLSRRRVSARTRIRGLNWTLDQQAIIWADTGSLTELAEGTSLRDGSAVLAKIAPARTQGSMYVFRVSTFQTPIVILNCVGFLKEKRICGLPLLPRVLGTHLIYETLRLESTRQSGETASVVLSFIDFITISRAGGDCVVLLVEHPGANQLARFFPS